MDEQERKDAIASRKSTRRPDKGDFTEHGKIPPQAIDLEEAVLGSLLLDCNAIHAVINILTVDVFYKEANQAIFEAIKSLYDKNSPIDILTVTNELRNLNKLELAGGAFGVTVLTSKVVSSANIEYHTSIIIQKYLARELIRTGGEIIQLGFDDGADAFDSISKADLSIAQINEYSIRGGGFIHVSVSSDKSMENAKKREILRKDGKTSGVTTGLHDFDKITGGLQKSDLIILAARPGMGKTSIALKLAISAAKVNVPVCFYSLEMSDDRLSDNLLLSLCNVDKDKFKNGYMSQDDWNDLSYAKAELNKMPINIDPNPSVSMRYIKANSRLMHRKGKCGIIFIDYLQLADVVSDERNRNREQEIAQASRQAKIIAKDLNIPVVLLSQLNRAVESRTDKKPQLSDLRESGAIEQDADLVAFIYRPEYYGFKEDKNGNSLIGVGKIIISKHRNGSCEEINFRYNESMTHISDYHQEKQPF